MGAIYTVSIPKICKYGLNICIYSDIHTYALIELHVYRYIQHENKIIMCKPLVLQEAAVSLHYEYLESYIS